MDCVILIRYPNGKVVAIMEDEEQLKVFPHRDAAIAYTDEAAKTNKHWAFFDFQIVELDEL